MATVLENTFTAAVRSGRDPDKVLDLTLTGDYLHIEMVGFEDRMERIATSENRAAEARAELKSQWGVVSLKALEKLAGPFHVKDVSATLTDGRFHLCVWRRVGSLRLLPAWLNIAHVDNPEGVAGFVRELRRRRQSSESVQVFPGPLDYWAGWVGIGLGLLIAIRRVRRPVPEDES
jgi:hypothetical protein